MHVVEAPFVTAWKRQWSDHQDGFFLWKALGPCSCRIAELFVQDYPHTVVADNDCFTDPFGPEAKRCHRDPGPNRHFHFLTADTSRASQASSRRTRCSACIWVASVHGGLFPSVSFSHIPRQADDTPRSRHMDSRKAPACSCQLPPRALRRHRRRHQRQHLAPFFHVFFRHLSPRVQTARFPPPLRSARSLLLPSQNVGLS